MATAADNVCLTKEPNMIVDRIAAKKSLAVTLALALGLVIPGGAFAQVDARVSAGAASVAAPAVASIAGLQTLSLSIPKFAPAVLSGAASMSPVLGLSAAAPSAQPASAYAASAAPEMFAAAPAMPSAAFGPAASVDAHPVIGLINQLQAAGVTLPETLATRADADKLDAAARALPGASPVRAQLAQLAASIRGSAGGDGSASGRAFDGAGNSPAGSADGAAPQGPNISAHELSASQVRYSPSAESLPDGTRAVPSVEQKIVGQDDAIEAIRFALEMPSEQYNLFVAGPEGSGREMAIRRILSEVAPARPTPNDLVAVTNFEDKDTPLILETAPGRGKALEAGVEEFVDAMEKGLIAELGSGATAQKQRQLLGQIQALQQKAQAEFDKKIASIKLAGKFDVYFKASANEDGHVRVTLGVTYQGKAMTQEEVSAKIAAGEFTQTEWTQAQAEVQEKKTGILEAYKKSMQAVSEQAQKIRSVVQDLEEKAAVALVNEQANELLGKVVPSVSSPEAEALQKRAQEREKEIQEAFQQVLKQKFGRFSAGVVSPGAIVLAFDKTPLTKASAVEALIAEGKFTRAEFDQAQNQFARKIAAIQGKAQEYSAMTEREAAAVRAAMPKPGPESAALIAYISQLAQYAADNYQIFLAAATPEDKAKPGTKPTDPQDFFRVSVLTDNGETRGAPVVFETNPTFERLFGAADDNARSVVIPGVGIVKSDGPGGPTLKGGSYLKANGGYLVINALAALQNPGVWQALMQAVSTGKAEIAEGGLTGMMSMKGDSYSVPAKVKVVLVGSPSIQMMLAQHDGDFVKNFLGVSQFQSTIMISEEAVDGFLNFLKHSVDGSSGRIADLTRGAIARVLEQAARMADSNQNFTAQFGALHGLLQEATYWAKRSGQTEVRAEDVDKALTAKRDREEGYAKRMLEFYKKNVFRVDTKGSAVGQINGLAVMGSFGVPMRITFVAVPGNPGIVSVDKDAGTTGASFNKALGNEWSWVVNEFGRAKPVRAQIRVAYEQSYSGIDGDSSTSTTLYGILSALSGVPIQQKFAVTGSADQFGNVQAIGGVNEKIEGFFALCKSRGLTGDQGIVIPKSNVADLQLSPEVAQAIKDGVFHVYAVDHVSQGMEILTGVPYQTIKDKAQKRLDEIGKSLTAAAKGK
ncbi:MAG: AAA family ATPase [Elusimicrobia bacterium]|nr:AAA family ATPase [Elusimicrobiota bacterium]